MRRPATKAKNGFGREGVHTGQPASVRTVARTPSLESARPCEASDSGRAKMAAEPG